MLLPIVSNGWKDWKFWQYSESAIADGVTDEINRPTRIDLNWFRGTEAELYQHANVQPADEKTYTVKDGDTFQSIAEGHGLSLTELLDANPSLLKVGAKLNIPALVNISAPTGGIGTSTNTGTTTGSTDSSGGSSGGTTASRTHTVKVGDTLFGIALKYGKTVDAIMATNPQITNRNIIFEGQEIKIP